jgi:hypothetical protein
VRQKGFEHHERYLGLDTRWPAQHEIFWVKRAPEFTNCLISPFPWEGKDLVKGTFSFRSLHPGMTQGRRLIILGWYTQKKIRFQSQNFPAFYSRKEEESTFNLFTENNSKEV